MSIVPLAIILAPVCAILTPEFQVWLDTDHLAADGLVRNPEERSMKFVLTIAVMEEASL